MVGFGLLIGNAAGVSNINETLTVLTNPQFNTFPNELAIERGQEVILKLTVSYTHFLCYNL